MRSIGRGCKRREAFSWTVLIGRGLVLSFFASSVSAFLLLLCLVFRVFDNLSGANGCEVPPVPIPNTEVKLTYADDTWLATTRENRSVPALLFILYLFHIPQ